MGALVTNLAISRDLLCQSVMMERYSTKGSFSSYSGRAFEVEPAESVISVSVRWEVDGLLDVTAALQVLIAKEGSFMRYSKMKSPISAKRNLSIPSTATTAPRISGVGLVGPGG